MHCSLPGSSVHGTSQTTVEWVAISFFRGSSWLRDWTHMFYIGRQILYHWATGDPLKVFKLSGFIYTITCHNLSGIPLLGHTKYVLFLKYTMHFIILRSTPGLPISWLYVFSLLKHAMSLLYKNQGRYDLWSLTLSV